VILDLMVLSLLNERKRFGGFSRPSGDKTHVFFVVFDYKSEILTTKNSNNKQEKTVGRTALGFKEVSHIIFSLLGSSRGLVVFWFNDPE
jgi:hypothetical protein